MKVIVLGSKNFGEKNNPAAMAAAIQEGTQKAVSVEQYNFEDLVFTITGSQRSITHYPSGADLVAADLVVAINWYAVKGGLRDIAFCVALYLKEKSVPVWNSEIAMQRSSTKLSAMWQLSAAGVAVPDTYFSLNQQALTSRNVSSKTIVKDIAGSRGRSNYLVSSQEELSQLLSQAGDGRFMLQSFIPNDYDLRVVCFGGKPRLVIKRQRSDDTTHLNNTSQGGAATIMPLESLPPEISQQAASICALLGREMAGIDYLVANDGSNRYICLEVNAVPQLTSGAFVDEKMSAFVSALDELVEL